MPINISLLKRPHCSTRSAFDKNLNARPSSIKPKTTFTVFSHPPLFGRELSQLGNRAKNANGSARARPKPPIPKDNCMAPPSVVSDPPNREPRIGPVHENETSARVSAIKNIPTPPPILEALSSILLLQEVGRVIS